MKKLLAVILLALITLPCYSQIVVFTDGDTTPSVSGNNIFKTANTTATIITTFDDGTSGQQITVMFADTDASANGSLMIYSNGTWRKVADLP